MCTEIVTTAPQFTPRVVDTWHTIDMMMMVDENEQFIGKF